MAERKIPILPGDGVTSMVARLRGLYAVTDDILLAGCLLPAVEAALEGGCRVVQYRSKKNDTVIKRSEARELLMLCRQFNALLLINDDVALANYIGADGVHLGQEDSSLLDARSQLGGDAIIGVTCHGSLTLASSAVDAGANYVAFGRFFDSATKPSASLAQRSILADARVQIPCPLVAIGGITLDNALMLKEAGADMLAVIGGLFSTASSDLATVREKARAFHAMYDNPISRETL